MASLFDDATSAYTGQGQQPDSSSLWGWLTSLFGQPATSQETYGSRLGPAHYTEDMRPPSPAAGATYTGPLVNPSLYPGSTPTGGDWTSGPASLRYAPPSLYTAGNPQQQAQWNQASTPQGWAALAAQAPGGGGAARAGTAAPATMVRPSAPPYYPAGGMLPSGAAPVAAPPSSYGVPPYYPAGGMLPFGAPLGSAPRRSTLTMTGAQPAPLGDITKMTSQQIEAIPDAVYNNMPELQRTQLRERWMALNPNR